MILFWSLLSAAPVEVASAQACSACHPSETAAWTTSRHAQSRTNANFSAAVAEAPFADWCLDCHAPRNAEGVTCQVCHPDHETPVVEGLCKGCHQFAGPNLSPPLRIGGDLLQSTWDEWVESGSGSSCQDCHLEEHRWRGAHDADFVRTALRVEGTPTSLRVSTTEALGHRIPTGDPFRRLEVQICSDPTCRTIVVQRTLGILHTADDEGFLRVTRDTRLGPPGHQHDAVVLKRPLATGEFWRVRLGLADPRLELPVEERYLDLFSGSFP